VLAQVTATKARKRITFGNTVLEENLDHRLVVLNHIVFASHLGVLIFSS